MTKFISYRCQICKKPLTPQELMCACGGFQQRIVEDETEISQTIYHERRTNACFALIENFQKEYQNEFADAMAKLEFYHKDDEKFAKEEYDCEKDVDLEPEPCPENYHNEGYD